MAIMVSPYQPIETLHTCTTKSYLSFFLSLSHAHTIDDSCFLVRFSVTLWVTKTTFSSDVLQDQVKKDLVASLYKVLMG